MMKLNKTSFIDFLSQEYFSFKVLKKDSFVDKNIVCETSKLQKVLDVFIAAEKVSKKKIIDDALISSWQKASELEKTKILNSFLKKQKFQKHNLDEMLLLLNKNKKAFKRKTAVLTNDWRSVLVTVCFLAFVLSTLIVRLFPGVTDEIVALGDKIYTPFFNRTIEKVVVKDNLDYTKNISKDDFGRFIKINSRHIVKPKDKNPYTIGITPDEIRGRVAGVSEENKIPQIDIAPPEISELDSVNDQTVSFMENFVNKQIELSEKINQKLKNIFK